MSGKYVHLAVSIGLVVSIFLPAVAYGDNAGYTKESVEVYLNSEKALHEAAALIITAQRANGLDQQPANAGNVTFSPAHQLQELRYSDLGVLADALGAEDSLRWAASTFIEGELTGLVFIDEEGGGLSCTTYYPDKGQAQILKSLSERETLVSDLRSRAYFSIQDNIVRGKNEAALRLLPEPQTLQRARETIAEKNDERVWQNRAGDETWTNGVGYTMPDTFWDRYPYVSPLLTLLFAVVVLASIAFLRYKYRRE